MNRIIRGKSIDCTIEAGKKPSLYITVSKQLFPTAVSRNKVKRLIREAYRVAYIPKHLTIHVRAKEKTIDFALIQKDFVGIAEAVRRYE